MANLHSNRGIALAATLIILTMLAILITGLLLITTSSLDLTSTRHESTQALYLAEAGINQVIYNWRTNPSGVPVNLGGALGGGSFSVTVENSASVPGGYDLTSIGVYGSGNRRSARGVMLTIQSSNSSPAWVHDVAAPNYDIDNGSYVEQGQHGPQTYPSYEVPFLDENGFEQYKAIAISQGHYYSGNLNISDSHPLPGEGVYFVEGNVNITGQASINGTLIVRGSITLTGGSTITIISPELHYPAMVAGGDITINSDKTIIEGVVWSNADISVSGNVEIDGAVVAKDTVTISSSKTTINYGTTIDGVFYSPEIGPPAYFSGDLSSPMVANSWREVPAL